MYKTQDGRRPDLENLEVNPVIGFIGDKLFPVVNVMEKTGTIYYSTLTADAAAQTNRSSGTAPTGVALTASNTTYTCAEVIKRYTVDKAEVKQYGGIEIADQLAAKASKRSVLRAMEEAVADAVLTNGTVSAVDIGSSFVAAVETGLESIRRYPGKKALVCSKTIFHRIMKYSEVTGYFGLSSAAIAVADAMSIVSRKPSALKMVLNSILGVDDILIGDDDQWYDSDVDKQDRAALISLPDTEIFSHKIDPVFGKNYLYLPDGSQPFEIESFYDDDVKLNKYDASAWYNLVEFNSNALYILNGIDAGNTITT